MFLIFFLSPAFQTLLRELEFKKPQLDELVNTAESLKTDANKLQLQTKGKVHACRSGFFMFLVIGSVLGYLRLPFERLQVHN